MANIIMTHERLRTLSVIPAWAQRENRLVVDYTHKAFGPKQQGLAIAEVVNARTKLGQLPTPVLTIEAGAVEHNERTMNGFVREHGAQIAPHGKTSMSPALWHHQVDSGSWGITVATAWQLRVAVRAGIKRIMLAGPILSVPDLLAVADALDEDAGLEILLWTDSQETSLFIVGEYPAHARPVGVLVERGAHGGRTGARTHDQALAAAEVLRAAPHVMLRGVAGWEGSFSGDSTTAVRITVARFCDEVAATFEAMAHLGLFEPKTRPIISVGGSKYFDIVVDRFADLLRSSLMPELILRSGCYLAHDDDLYRRTSPLGGDGAQGLRPALHVWAQVVSRPEPELAILNLGRRDVSYDAGLPIPQCVRGRDERYSREALIGASITHLNDQHAYLRLRSDSALRVGEVVRCGISHPCTTFDKWALIPVIQDADAGDPVVVGAIKTYF